MVVLLGHSDRSLESTEIRLMHVFVMLVCSMLYILFSVKQELKNTEWKYQEGSEKCADVVSMLTAIT